MISPSVQDKHICHTAALTQPFFEPQAERLKESLLVLWWGESGKLPILHGQHMHRMSTLWCCPLRRACNLLHIIDNDSLENTSALQRIRILQMTPLIQNRAHQNLCSQGCDPRRLRPHNSGTLAGLGHSTLLNGSQTRRQEVRALSRPEQNSLPQHHSNLIV